MTYTFGVGTCEKTDTKIIFVGEPDPIDAGNDQVLCVDAPAITLIASLPDGVWSGNGITNTTTGVFNPGVALVGNHNIVYTYTNSRNRLCEYGHISYRSETIASCEYSRA